MTTKYQHTNGHDLRKHVWKDDRMVCFKCAPGAEERMPVCRYHDLHYGTRPLLEGRVVAVTKDDRRCKVVPGMENIGGGWVDIKDIVVYVDYF